MTPGERIDLARRRKGWTQAELAEALGMKQQSVSGLIAGRFPGTSRIEEIAKVLAVPIEWITTGYPPQPWERGLVEQAPAPADDNLSATLLEQQRQISALLAEQRERDALNRRQAIEIAALEADIAQLRAERDRLAAERSDRAAKQRGRRKTTGV